MTTFSGRDPDALSQEERFALFDLPLDIEEETPVEEPVAEEAEEAPVVEEAVAEAPAPAETTVEAPEPEETPEPALDEAPAEVVAEEAPVEEAPALEEGETWKTRYDDLRRTEMAALEKERQRATAAEEQLAQILSQRQQPRISEEQLQALAQQAEAVGLEPEQIAVMAKIMEAANPQDDTMVNYLASQAEEARTNAATTLAQQEAQTLQSFQMDHPEILAEPAKQQELAHFMYDIGAATFLDQYGQELPEEIPYEQKLAYVAQGQAQMNSWPPGQPLDRYALELAYEAVQNPDLAFILRANPVLCQTDEGLNWAREQASSRASARGVTTLPTQAKTKEEIEASLAAAETLGGTSGAEPIKGEQQFLERKEVHFSK